MAQGGLLLSPVSLNCFDVFPGKTQRGLQDECIYSASLLTIHRLLTVCFKLVLCTRRKLMLAINHLVLNLITLVLIKAHNESKKHSILIWMHEKKPEFHWHFFLVVITIRFRNLYQIFFLNFCLQLWAIASHYLFNTKWKSPYYSSYFLFVKILTHCNQVTFLALFLLNETDGAL